MDAAVLVKLLGLHGTDPRVEDALRAYGVMHRPKLGIDLDDADGPVVKSQDRNRSGVELSGRSRGATSFA
jgi:hypothetical protein